MVYLHFKKIPSFGVFLNALQRNIFVYFMAIWYILWPFGVLWPSGLFCGQLVNVHFPILVWFTEKNLATLVHHWPGDSMHPK
jgi:hypothetical protein